MYPKVFSADIPTLCRKKLLCRPPFPPLLQASFLPRPCARSGSSKNCSPTAIMAKEKGQISSKYQDWWGQNGQTCLVKYTWNVYPLVMLHRRRDQMPSYSMPHTGWEQDFQLIVFDNPNIQRMFFFAYRLHIAPHSLYITSYNHQITICFCMLFISWESLVSWHLHHKNQLN